MRRAVTWLGGIVLVAVTAWATKVVDLILPNLVPSPLEVCRDVGACKGSVLCTDEEKLPAPAVFDYGYPKRCPAWVHIAKSPYCGYCRVVGNDANILKCTMGTDHGLTGQEFEGVLEGGGPYENECSWIDDHGAPALRAVIGDTHDRVSITPVTQGHIGPTRVQPK